MKVVFYLSTIGLAPTSLKELHTQIAKFAEKRPDSTSTDSSSGDKAFAEFIKDKFQAVSGHGCWCYLDAGWRDDDQVARNKPAIQAHGMAVDPIDDSCRDLINNYGSEMDSEALGEYKIICLKNSRHIRMNRILKSTRQQFQSVNRYLQDVFPEIKFYVFLSEPYRTMLPE